MTQWLDKPQAIRVGADLDWQRLVHYLREHVPDLQDDPSVQQFGGGYSNLTYLLTFANRRLVLRRPPLGWKIKTAHDMSREYRLLSHLYPTYGKVPQPLLYCEDEEVMGAPFYVMEHVAGVILRAKMPAGMQPPSDLMRGISQALVTELVALHSLDLADVGLAQFGKPEGYVARQIEGWTRRYQKAQTDDIPAMDFVGQWLASHQPPENAGRLIHNDFKYDNVILDPDNWTRIVAVLDWEMATVGDPLLDLGTMLSYVVQADDPPILAALALGPTTLPGNLTRREIVEMYADFRGEGVAHAVFYYAYGLFKLAGIVQQLYKRWQLGYSQDVRSAVLIEAVSVCASIAQQAIQAGAI